MRSIILLLQTIAVAVLSLLLADSTALLAQSGVWHFAVSGDSRNCGDVVMPAIAKSAAANQAAFYWHAGDFRAIYRLPHGGSVQAWISLSGFKLAHYRLGVLRLRTSTSSLAALQPDQYETGDDQRRGK